MKKFVAFLLAVLVATSCSKETSNSAGEDENQKELIEDFNIQVDGIEENQVILTKTIITVAATANSSQIENIKVSVNGLAIYESTTSFAFEINPETMTIGASAMTIEATGKNGKMISLEISFELQVKLLSVYVPEGYFSQQNSESFAFISDSDGNPLVSKPLDTENVLIDFHAPDGYHITDKFMLTIIRKSQIGYYRLETIQDLDYFQDLTFNLSRTNGYDFRQVPISLVDLDQNATIGGNGYGRTMDTFDPNNRNLILLERESTPEDIFVLHTAADLNGNHGFAKIKRDEIGDILELSQADFNTSNVSYSSWPSRSTSTHYSLRAYQNQEDFEANRWHDAKFTYGSNNGVYRFPYINNFPFYRHSYFETWNNKYNYSYLADGLPLDEYNSPQEWVNSFVVNGSNISFNTDIQNIDCAELKIFNQTNTNWLLLFEKNDGEKNIVIPTLPKELSELEIGSTNYSVSTTYVRNYSTIDGYSEYIENIKSKNLEKSYISGFLEVFSTYEN